MQLKGKNENSIGHTMLFFSTICVFYAFSLRLRRDFSLRLQAGDMGKKAQSDFLYHWNTDFTFGFQMLFSMTAMETTCPSQLQRTKPAILEIRLLLDTIWGCRD